MPKKKLNTAGIANELEQSIFFSSHNASSPKTVATGEDQQHAALSPTPSSAPDPSLTPVIPLIESNKTTTENTERIIRTVEPTGRTVEQDHTSSLLDEITHGVKRDKRPTERYSFEIYRDQIPQIEEMQYLFKQRTGQKLSASRILREALEAYLQHAFEAMKRKQ